MVPHRPARTRDALRAVPAAPAWDPLVSAFATSPHGVAIADAWTGRWTSVNPALAHLLGYSPQQLLDLGLAAVTHRDDQHLGPEAVHALVRGHDAIGPIHQRFVRADGAV